MKRLKISVPGRDGMETDELATDSKAQMSFVFYVERYGNRRSKLGKLNAGEVKADV